MSHLWHRCSETTLKWFDHNKSEVVAASQCSSICTDLKQEAPRREMPWKLFSVEHISLSINSLWDWFCGIWVPSSTGFWSSLDGLLRTGRPFDIRSNRMSGSLGTKTSPWSNQINKQINIEQHNYCWFPIGNRHHSALFELQCSI